MFSVMTKGSTTLDTAIPLFTTTITAMGLFSSLSFLATTARKGSISYTVGVMHNECTNWLKHLSMYLLVGLSQITHKRIIYRGI